MPKSPLALYRSLLAAGELHEDAVQERAVMRFEALGRALAGYTPAVPSAEGGLSGLRARLGFGGRKIEAAAPLAPRGLYLHGPVGRGKSMLMDLFFRTVPVKAKRRVHFQAFMRDFHAAMHQWRAKGGGEADPIPPLAAAMAREAWLLCLDELEVRDIADAMIVGRVFEHLFKAGVVVVTTSNRPPEDLYRDGLQREKFLPFIGLIRERLEEVELSSPTDYRLGRLQGAPVFYAPLGPDSEAALAHLFERLTAGQPVHPDMVAVGGRSIIVPEAAGDVARFTFADLCEAPLGPSDYMEIGSHYDIVLVSGVPRLTPAKRDAARRFVTLVDALYEHRTLLALTLDAPPQDLYTEGDGAFEFHRTVSRLMEMQSEDYLGSRHRV